MCEMKRANVSKEERQLKDRFATTLATPASIAADIRLPRGDISNPPPRLSELLLLDISFAWGHAGLDHRQKVQMSFYLGV